MGWVFPREQGATKESQGNKYRVVRSDYDGLAGIGVIPEENPHDNHIRWGVWGRPTLRVNEFGFEWDTEADIIRYRLGTFGDVTDGLSNTIMVVERGGRPFHMVDGRPKVTTDNPDGDYGGQNGWSASNSLSFRTNVHNVGVDHDNATGIYSDHAGGAYVALADGSVTFLSESTDIATLAKMIGRSDGEQ